MRQPEPDRRHRLGNYGAGTLWSVKSRSGVCIFFNDTPIARRGKRIGKTRHRNLEKQVGWYVAANYNFASLDSAFTNFFSFLSAFLFGLRIRCRPTDRR
jgi:hypothetical protein